MGTTKTVLWLGLTCGFPVFSMAPDAEVRLTWQKTGSTPSVKVSLICRGTAETVLPTPGIAVTNMAWARAGFAVSKNAAWAINVIVREYFMISSLEQGLPNR